MAKYASLLLIVFASPAFAASGPFFSLSNTDFVVTLAFLVFIGILLYYKVPGKAGSMLDERAAQIKTELDQAKALREEAALLLAVYERKQKDVKAQAEQIVMIAQKEAEDAAQKAQADLKESIARRLIAAEETIQAAEAKALKDVRERAINVAIDAASDILTEKMNPEQLAQGIDASIAQVEAHLN